MSQIQIARLTDQIWTVTLLTPVQVTGTHANRYEVIGRMIAAPDAWYIELPEWRSDGVNWHRQMHAYVTEAAALRAITEWKARAS